MKKFYVILAALTMVGMVCSCDKDPQQEGGKNGKDGKDGGVEFKIDGNFDDWKDASIASADLSEIEETNYANLLLMKAAGDSKKIYFYFEYELQEDPAQEVAPIDILINSDGDPTTGFTSWIWSKEDCGWDFMLESEAGFLADGGKAISDLADMAVYKCIEGDGQDAWDAGSVFEKQNAEDFIACKGVVNGGVAYFEVSVLRSIVNANKAGTISFGVTMSNAAWDTMGILPQSPDGIGQAGMLEVKLP